MGSQRQAPAAFPSGRRLGGPQRRSGRVQKISRAPRFDPRTVHPVASRYTDYATPAHAFLMVGEYSGDGVL